MAFSAPSALSRRRVLQSACALLPIAQLAPAAAQAYPARTVRVIVPFPPGGTTDVVTRLVMTQVGNALGQPFIIDNKPGAGTVIGVDAAAKAAPDGYTLVTVANSFTVNTTLIKTLPYDGEKDLRPVALMGLSEHVLATHPRSGVRTLADLIAAARKAPGQLSFASFGSGTSAHIAGEMLKAKAGIDLIHVPYKGQAPALNDLLGGQVTVMFGNWPEFRGHIEAGKLVAIGMATEKRSVFAPNVPTLAEQGSLVVSNSWQGLLAPARTPDAIVEQLNAAVGQAIASPQVQETFRKNGIVSQARSVAEVAAFLRSETARYAEVIRSAHITVDG